MLEENAMAEEKRRSFLRSLVGGGIGASILSFLYPVLNFVLPPKSSGSGPQSMEVDATGLKPNSGNVIQFGSQPAMLVRTEEGELRAFSAVCTHLGCTVNYDPNSKSIWCPCHNAAFDLHGRVIGGPPPAPLPEYAVNERDGKVIITKNA